jgi:hypothetical protein
LNKLNHDPFISFFPLNTHPALSTLSTKNSDQVRGKWEVKRNEEGKMRRGKIQKNGIQIWKKKIFVKKNSKISNYFKNFKIKIGNLGREKVGVRNKIKE